MPLPPSGPPGAAAEWAHLRDRLLADLRHGVFTGGEHLRLPDLVDRYATSPARLRRALESLRAIGWVEIDDDGAVNVRRPTVEDWAEALRLQVGFVELCARDAIPRLDDDDRERFRELVARARRFALLRDQGFTESMLNTTRFLMDRSSNSLLRRLTQETISRSAYLLNPTPPYEQWDMDAFLGLMLEAVETGDVELGVEAAQLWHEPMERHIADVRARYASMDS